MENRTISGNIVISYEKQTGYNDINNTQADLKNVLAGLDANTDYLRSFCLPQIGEIKAGLFPATPLGWYECNGDTVNIDSDIGLALNSLSDSYKNIVGIAVNSGNNTINFPKLVVNTGSVSGSSSGAFNLTSYNVIDITTGATSTISTTPVIFLGV